MDPASVTAAAIATAREAGLPAQVEAAFADLVREVLDARRWALRARRNVRPGDAARVFALHELGLTQSGG